jgi:hypothetical protein
MVLFTHVNLEEYGRELKVVDAWEKMEEGD